jgi:hypothetical protein
LALARNQLEDARTAWRSARDLSAAVGMVRYEQLAAQLLSESGGADSAPGVRRVEAGISAP